MNYGTEYGVNTERYTMERAMLIEKVSHNYGDEV
jgi:hypothetical protein